MKKQLHKLIIHLTKIATVGCITLGATFLNAQTPITVTNGDFELPNTTKQQNWSNVPGWNSDTAASDSGVEGSAGSWTAFIMNSDPSVYNLTDHNISDGEEFQVNVNVWDIWNGPKFIVTLYYNNGNGIRTVLGTQTFDIAPSTTVPVSFSATATASSVGSKLGIEFDNLSGDGGAGWTGFDDVTLTVSSTLGNKDFKTDGLSLYPNPSKDGYFNISLKTIDTSVNIKAYTILGKEVFNKNFAPTSKTVEVKHNLKAGIYLIKVNDTSASKLIVK